MRLPSILPFLYCLLFSLVVAAPAFAHHLPPGMEDVDEFGDSASFLLGFNHPLTGLDHLAAALLTGVVAARFARTGRVALLAGALGALLAGSLTARAGLMLPAGEAMLLVSVIAAFAVILFRSPGPLRIGAGALLAFQVWHGNAHAREAPSTGSSGHYLAGVCMAAVLTMVIGLALALLAERWMPARAGEALNA